MPPNIENTPTRDDVIAYFTASEARYRLPVERPVRVQMIQSGAGALLLSTPGLVVNDTLVVSSRIPSADEVSAWLSAAGSSAAAKRGSMDRDILSPRPAAPAARPNLRAVLLLGLAAIAWLIAYTIIQPLAQWLAYDLFNLPENSHLGEAVVFFRSVSVSFLMTQVERKGRRFSGSSSSARSSR